MRMDICDIRRLPLKRSSAWEELAGSAWLEDEQPIVADTVLAASTLFRINLSYTRCGAPQEAVRAAHRRRHGFCSVNAFLYATRSLRSAQEPARAGGRSLRRFIIRLDLPDAQIHLIGKLSFWFE